MEKQSMKTETAKSLFILLEEKLHCILNCILLVLQLLNRTQLTTRRMTRNELKLSVYIN